MKFDLNRCVECGQLLTDTRLKIEQSDLFSFCSEFCMYNAVRDSFENPEDRRDLKFTPTDPRDTHWRRPELQPMIRRRLLAYRKRWEEEFDYRSAKDERERLEKEQEELRKQREFDELIKPRPVPEALRFEHTHILAPSGAGKTTLIENLFLKDRDCAYVIIDPKGLMVKRLLSLSVLPEDRLIYIDPTRDRLPALNMFRPDIHAETDRQRTQVLNQLVEMFGYIFSTTGARLTQRQSIPFSYVVRLVLMMQGDLNTLMDVLEDTHQARKFAGPIAELSKIDRGAARFFASDFYTAAFGETKQQIKTRLHEIIGRQELMDMLSAPDNKLSLYDAIQDGKIVLVNTAFPQLGLGGSSLLGRYIIAATLNAAFARSLSLPERQWRPVHLVIDEYQDFADEEGTPRLLRLAREYKLGVTIAHQIMHAEELTESLRTSISSCSVKYCSRPRAVDIMTMARDFQCEPDFLIKTCTKTETHGRFACTFTGLDHPFLYEFPFGATDQMLKRTPADLERFLRENDRRLQPESRQLQRIPQAAPVPVSDTQPTKKSSPGRSDEPW